MLVNNQNYLMVIRGLVVVGIKLMGLMDVNYALQPLELSLLAHHCSLKFFKIILCNLYSHS